MIISFYENRKIYAMISGLIILLGIVFMFVNGVQVDIQFKGGSILKYNYVGEVDADRVAETASTAIDRLVTAQTTTEVATGEQRIVLNLSGQRGLDPESQEKLDQALKADFPDAGFTLSESSMVEPFYSTRFLQRSLLALFLAATLIVAYVWWSFRRVNGLVAGVTALIALGHDLLVAFFACVIFKIPLSDSFIAVCLTILGYSINDTIVIYDRIRENSQIDRKAPFSFIVNKSITQSLSRSINTGLSTFLAIGMIYVLAALNGIDSIQAFALPMTIGTISGCYSTICIAGPLWVWWKERQAEKKKVAPKTA